MKIITINDKDLPKGSVCEVIRENKNSYRVLYAFMGHSGYETIKKQNCKRYNPYHHNTVHKLKHLAKKRVKIKNSNNL